MNIERAEQIVEMIEPLSDGPATVAHVLIYLCHIHGITCDEMLTALRAQWALYDQHVHHDQSLN